MNLVLTRSEFTSDGIFGVLEGSVLNIGPTDQPIAHTLEHAYLSMDGILTYKIPAGDYICRRGMHQLAHMKTPFETFEVCDVPGHTGICWHVGNENADSDGCILLGEEVVTLNGVRLITGSRIAFNRFMALQEGVNEFRLTVG